MTKKYLIDKLNLSTDYIYISEDQFAYDTDQFNELKKNDLSDLVNIPSDQLEQGEKVIFIQEKYNQIRKHTIFIMYSLMGRIEDWSQRLTPLGSALMFKKNVILEMTGLGLDWYMSTMIDEFHHYKYDINIVYPFTTNINFLYKRSIENFKKKLSENNINKFKKIFVYGTKTLDFNKNANPNILYERDDKEVIVTDPLFIHHISTI